MGAFFFVSGQNFVSKAWGKINILNLGIVPPPSPRSLLIFWACFFPSRKKKGKKFCGVGFFSFKMGFFFRKKLPNRQKTMKKKN